MKIKLDSIKDSLNLRFGQNYYMVRTGDGFLEIMPENIDKDSVLACLAGFLKVNISETMTIDFVTSNNNESAAVKSFSKYVLN